MLKIVALVLALTGALLIFSPETLIPPTSTNNILLFAKNNNLLVGAVLIGLAYFMFLRLKKSHYPLPFPLVETTTEMPQTTPEYYSTNE